MIFSRQSSNVAPQVVFPIASLRKFSYLIGIPKEKLEWLSENISAHYKPFLKKTGDKSRIIDNPTGLLKEAQKRINERILTKIELPSFVIGGVKGKKPHEHPKLHVGKRVVVTLDIRDCFPSVTNSQIYKVWHGQIGCSHDVAHLATKLTTHNGHLPLGAPTSSFLANLALHQSMCRVKKLSADANLVMSQYIDDIAFSGEELPTEFINAVIGEFSKSGYTIKRTKIKVMRAHNRQVVTKKIVNRKVSLVYQKRDNVRAALHEIGFIDPHSKEYGKKFRSLQGRIKDLGDCHPDKAQKMLIEFNRLPKPKINH